MSKMENIETGVFADFVEYVKKENLVDKVKMRICYPYEYAHIGRGEVSIKMYAFYGQSLRPVDVAAILFNEGKEDVVALLLNGVTREMEKVSVNHNDLICVVEEGSSVIEGYLDGFYYYQLMASMTALYPRMGMNPYYPALGLGEAGEVQNQVKKIMRDDNGKIDQKRTMSIVKELGDILWYVAAMCNEIGVSMTDVAKLNIEKLYKRKEDGTIQGSGDER